MTTFLQDRSRSERVSLAPLSSAIGALALLVFAVSAQGVCAQDGSEGGSIGGSIAGPSPTHMAAPSSRHRARPSSSRRAAEVSQSDRSARRNPARQAGGFDGAWSVSAGGPCAAAGTNQVVISNGRISGQGGSGTVSRNGAVRTYGSVNGLTIIGTGQISGQSATGSYRQSDGCVGRWSAYKL